MSYNDSFEREGAKGDSSASQAVGAIESEMGNAVHLLGRLLHRLRSGRDPFRPRELLGVHSYLAQRPEIFAIAFFGYTGAYLARNNFKIVANHYVTENGWTLHQVGGVLTAFTLSYGVGKIVLGLVVDRWSLRSVFSVALATSALTCMMMAFAATPSSLAALMVVNGFVQGACAPAALAMIGSWYPNPLRGSRVALWNTSQNLGASILPLLIGISIAVIMPGDWRAAYIIPGVCALAIAAWVYTRGSDRPWREGLPTLQMMYGRAGVPDLPLPSDHYVEIVRQYVVSSRPLLVLSVINTALYCIRFGVINWLTVVLEERGLTARSGEWVFAALEFSAIPSSILFAYIAWRWPNRLSSAGAFAMVVLAGGLAAWSFAYTPQQVAIVAALLGALMYGPQIIVNALTLNFVPARAAGFAVGVVGAAGYLIGETLANVGIPYLVHAFGWWVVYVILAILALCCSVGYRSLREWEDRVVRLK